MGKAIIFLRVSTVSQNLESQELIARRLAHADGFEDNDILSPIKYKESAVKLEEKDREGLQDLYKILDDRKDIEAIYVTELSRLSRKEGVLIKIRDTLIAKKVQLVCGSPAFRLLDNNKRLDKMAALVFAIFSCFAEQEAVEKKERFARGKEQKALENKWSGGNIPFGYRVDKEKDNLIVVDPIAAEIVREVFNLYESGISQAKLAKHFAQRGVSNLTISFINNILNNERYTGREHVYPGSSYKRKYPIIITQAQYDRCREIAKQNNTVADKTLNVYYAHHLIRCTKCGCYFSASGSKVDYHCYDAFQVNRKYDHRSTKQCTSRLNISINVVDSLLWKIGQEAELDYIINSAEKDKEKFRADIEDLTIKLSAVNQRLEEVAAKRKRIVLSYINGNIDETDEGKLLNEVDNQKNEILQEQIDFQEKIEHLVDLSEGLNDFYSLGTVKDIVSHLEKILKLKEKIASINDDEQRSKIIHRHISKMTVENRDIDYEYKIGKKKVKARYVTIWFYNKKIQYYYIIPASGKGTHSIILSSDTEGNIGEKVEYKYLERFIDKGKRKRHQMEREKRKLELEALYPQDKYARSYNELGNFLGFNGNSALHAAYRWVKNGILESALVGKYRGKNVFDKSKCINLLRVVANEHSRQAYEAREILRRMNVYDEK